MSEPTTERPPLSTRVRRLAAAAVALAGVFGLYQTVYGSTLLAAVATIAILLLAAVGVR